MRIDVVGKHLEVTPAIQEYAQKKVDKLTKIFDGTQQIRVYVESPQGKKSEFHVEVVVTVVKHEDFVAKADLTEYDLSGMKRMRFEFAPKDKRVNMRLPASLYEAVKKRASRAGVPYQRFIRQVLEAAIETAPRPR